MRFRERPTWPFLVAVEDAATDQVSPAKPRIDADLPPVSPALKRLAAGLGAGGEVGLAVAVHVRDRRVRQPIDFPWEELVSNFSQWNRRRALVKTPTSQNGGGEAKLWALQRPHPFDAFRDRKLDTECLNQSQMSLRPQAALQCQAYGPAAVAD